MENVFIWVLVFAGTTVGFLGAFLFASERDLKAKSRRLEEVERKLTSMEGGYPAEASAEQRNTEARETEKLHAKNAELLGKITELTTELEANRAKISEASAIQIRHSDLESVNAELRDENRRLGEENTELRAALQSSQSRLGETEGHHRETSEKTSRLETEIASLRQELNESRMRARELDEAQERLAQAESQDSALSETRRRLEDEIATLKDELAASRKKFQALEPTQGRLRELERRHREVREVNQRLQNELSELRARLARSVQHSVRIGAARDRLDEVQAKQEQIAEIHREIQGEILEIQKLLGADTEHTRQHDLPVTTLYRAEGETTETRDAAPGQRPDPSAEHSLQAVKNHLEAGRNEEALSCLEVLLAHEPDNREAKLYELLASVQLHNVYGYESRIDAIKDMANLSESERIAARDIFLRRASEAQNRGNDDDMLRYRAWAKNVIYRTPFGAASPATTPVNGNSRAREPHADATEESEAPRAAQPSQTAASGVAAAMQGKKARAIFAAAMLIFLLAGVLAAAFLRSKRAAAIPESKSQVEATSAAMEPRSSGLAGDARPNREGGPVVRAPSNRPTPAARSNAKTTPAVRGPTPPIRGRYEVVRPTNVYSEASEKSEMLASLEPGIMVNVIDGRNGWLEIRSKYGRPPGFVKKEAVARVKKR